MKKILIALSLIVLSFSQLNATCQQSYENNIANHWIHRGDVQSPVLVLGLASIALVGVTVVPAIIGAGVTAGSIGAYYTFYKINEKKQRTMIRILNQAEYLLNAKRIPKVDTNFYKEIEVDAKNLKKRYEQIKENSKIKRHNREVRRANKKLTNELKLSVDAFDKFYLSVHQRVGEISKVDLANAVTYVNAKDMFCNNEIKAVVSAKKKVESDSANKLVNRKEAIEYFQKNVQTTLAEIIKNEWSFQVLTLE